MEIAIPNLMLHKNLYTPLYGVHVIGTRFSPTVNMDVVVRNLYNVEVRLHETPKQKRTF